MQKLIKKQILTRMPCAVVWTLLAAGWTAARGDETPPARPPLAAHGALQERLGDPALRLLDARPRAEYDKGHIPGAVWVDAKAVQALAARPGGLTDRAAWEAWIRPLGIGPRTEILVYDNQRQREAARIWWLLRYLGVEKVGLIDGHFPYWQKSGRPVATEKPVVAPRPFAVHFQADRHATRAQVLEALRDGRATIIDARSPEEYAGSRKEAKRAGHIPGACPLEWSDLVDKDGRFLDADALRARIEALGIATRPGRPVITHCQSGGRASVDAFALERLGIEARNYYLGWSDWGNAPDGATPITTEPGTKPGVGASPRKN